MTCDFNWTLAREFILVFALAILGITVSTSLSIASSVFAASQNLGFEITECTIRRNSTYEISGPCPDADIKEVETSTSITEKTESDPNLSRQTPEDDTLRTGDPTLIPEISKLTDPFRSLK